MARNRNKKSLNFALRRSAESPREVIGDVTYRKISERDIPCTSLSLWNLDLLNKHSK